MPDNINHPSHYTQGGIECIDALKAATAGLEGIDAVCTANAIKYLWRWRHKNGIEDLRKAIWYINRLIAENEPQNCPYRQANSPSPERGIKMLLLEIATAALAAVCALLSALNIPTWPVSCIYWVFVAVYRFIGINKKLKKENKP